MKRSYPPLPHSQPPNSYGSVAARSSAALTVAKSLRYGLVFAVQAVLMNFMTPDEFGLMKYVTIILGIVNLIATVGLNTAIVQKKELSDGEIGPLFTLNLLVCAGLFVIVFMSAPLIAAIFGERDLIALVRVGALIIPIGGVSTIHRALLQREFKYGTFSIIEVISAIVSSAVSVTLAFKGFGAWALCWSLIAFHLCSSGLCFATRRGIALTFGAGLSLALPLFWFSSGWALLRLIDYISANLGGLLMGRFFGSRVLGAYTVAFDMVTIPQIGFGLTLVPVALSALSRLQDDDERIKSAYLKLVFFTSTVSVIYCVIVGLCATDIIKTITMLKPNGNWDETAVFLHYLAPLGLIYSWSCCLGVIWTVKRKIKFQIMWTTAMTLSTAAFILLGAFYGYFGVCAALLARAILTFPIVLYALKKVSNISPVRYLAALWPSLVCGGVAAVVCAALMYLFTALFPIHHAARLAVCAILSTIVFGAMLMLFFKERIKTLKRYFNPATLSAGD